MGNKTESGNCCFVREISGSGMRETGSEDSGRAYSGTPVGIHVPDSQLIKHKTRGTILGLLGWVHIRAPHA